jgi:hypothetical protein
MKSKPLASLLGLAGALLLALATSGYSGDIVYHATLCNPIPSHVGLALYDTYGIANASASQSLEISCGGAVQILSKIEKVEVVVYDRNPSRTLTCTLTLVDLFGNWLWRDSDFSPNTGPDWQLLEFTPNDGTHTINLRCIIPPWTQSDGFSHVTSYRVRSTP